MFDELSVDLAKFADARIINEVRQGDKVKHCVMEAKEGNLLEGAHHGHGVMDAQLGVFRAAGGEGGIGVGLLLVRNC